MSVMRLVLIAWLVMGLTLVYFAGRAAGKREADRWYAAHPSERRVVRDIYNFVGHGWDCDETIQGFVLCVPIEEPTR